MAHSVNIVPTTPTSVLLQEREWLVPFAASDTLPQLLPPEAARRFDDLRSALREAKAGRAPHRTQLQHGSLTPADARLRAATRYYEQHVLAWYALGRVSEARSAREAIARQRRESTQVELRRNGG
jgi:hypothetical protein